MPETFHWIQQKDKKMALVQLNNVEKAIIALIKLHNYQILFRQKM